MRARSGCSGTAIPAAVKRPKTAAMGWAHLGGVVTAALLWSATILPLYFWLGSVFVQYLSFIVFVIAFGIGSAAGAIRALVSSESTGWIVHLWAWSRSLAAGEALAWVYLLLTAAVLFVGSMLPSVRLYQRREF
ncbi:hypothetical protein CVV65_13850 [Kyrpidia spormannii]|uniref:Uncharacterized protein n=2 Tax=Kyrpidia spormannii TaxID=2055160 RepID=A0A2K8N9T3_9BACL|nr:hypothetical protein CVV65_13850 [Kyrpidia spormannii]